MPKNAAETIASGDWEPKDAEIQLAGTYSVINASNTNANAMNLPTIQMAPNVSFSKRL